MRHAIVLVALAVAACGPGEGSPEPSATAVATTDPPAITAPLTSAAPDPTGSGEYTDDQVTSLNTYAAVLIAYCTDPATADVARVWATPDNIAAQVFAEYEFLITRETAEALADAC